MNQTAIHQRVRLTQFDASDRAHANHGSLAAATELFELNAAAARRRAKSKPGIEVRSGSAVVKIFGPGPYWISWYELVEGRQIRRRKKRASLKKAREFAARKAEELANNDVYLQSFSAADRASHLRAVENLLGCRKTIEQATAEYAEAFLELGGASLLEAVRFFKANRPAAVAAIPIPTLVENFLQAREADGIGERWLRSLASQLAKLAGKFTCPLYSLRAQELNAWLRGLPGGPRTRLNYRGALSALITFARENGHVPETWKEFDRVAAPAVKTVEIKILTPEQLARLLAIAQPALVPFIALSAFAGIRHEEMNGKKALLDWRDVRLEERLIYVPIRVGKTDTDRIVPISDNLAAWLNAHRRPNGPVCALQNASNALCRKKAKAGIPAGKNETRNTLRKSFISYRLALVKNIAQVAEDAGNSPAKIKSNYRRPIPEAEAKRWFEIWPTNASILQLNFKL